MTPQRLLLYWLFAIGFSAVCALIAARVLPAFEERLQAYNKRRLAARLARGNDRYFEELRSLQSAVERPYEAHGFGWHFVRIFAFMIFGFAMSRFADFLIPFFSE